MTIVSKSSKTKDLILDSGLSPVEKFTFVSDTTSNKNENCTGESDIESVVEDRNKKDTSEVKNSNRYDSKKWRKKWYNIRHWSIFS